jgi:hypothetical protein
MPDYLIALISIVPIALWLAVAVIDAGFLPNVNEWLAESGNPVRLATWLIALVIVAITAISPTNTLLGSLRTEAISTAFAVIVINELGNYRATLQEKRRIIEQMGSPVNDAALEAVRLVRKNGWLEDGSLDGAVLMGARLEWADLRNAHLQNANLWGVNLEGAVLFDVCLEGAELSCTRLNNAHLSNASLENAILWNASLEYATLLAVELAGANLSYANMKNANLWGANMEDANLRGAVLIQARYNTQTKWPKGFDPESALAQFDEMDLPATGIE